MDIIQIANRMIKGIAEKIQKGYYTETAEKIDLERGEQEMSGLAVTLMYWTKVKETCEQYPSISEKIIKNLAFEQIGLKNEYKQHQKKLTQRF